jgi:hypothetical protein
MLLPALFACAPESAIAPVGFDALLATPDAGVVTMLLATWTQDAEADTWVEFQVDGGDWEASPAVTRGEGAQQEWILGVPADTDVRFRIVGDQDGLRSESEVATGRTGTLPTDLTEDLVGPTVSEWDAAGAGEARWLFGSVDVNGGGAYSGPFWLYIVDREGRFVWYRDLEYNSSMFPRVARDGTHLAWETRYLLDPTGENSAVHRSSLDGLRTAEVPTPGLGWTWDETTDGDLLYDRHDGDLSATLESVAPDGTRSTLWDCTAWLAPLDPDPEHCYTNTVNWTESRDTVLWSTYWGDFVVELDRASGEVLWYAGSLEGGLRFDPPEAAFDLQHYPNYTPDGTLLVSTHIADQEGEQRAREYTVGDDALTEVWSYGEGVDSWAKYSGEAVRLDDGHTLINYGTGGDVREIDAQGNTVWHLEFGADFTLGHTDFISDLYALNVGP